jgi:tetratricopeptide (TPR) repeat protein
MAFNNRGLVKKTLNDLEGANADYTKAIEINPNLAPAYFNRGSIKILIEHPEESCDDFKRAFALGQNKAIEYISKYCK